MVRRRDVRILRVNTVHIFFLLLLAETNNTHNRSAWNPFNYDSCDIGQDDRYYLRQSLNLVRDSLVGL